MKAASNNSSGLATNLRTKAERRLRVTPRAIAQLPLKDVKQLVQELQVHQIELEMQNDELLRAQLELEESRGCYTDLYDFAPAAYLTLSASREILEANLSAGLLLGMDRSKLIHQNFTRFISPAAQDTFYLFYRQIFRSDARRSLELDLVSGKSKSLVVQLEAAPDSASGNRKQCHVSLVDITQRKQAELALRRSEQDLSEFFNHSPIGLEWLSARGFIVRANQAQLDALGYSSEEYLGHFFGEFCADPADANQLLKRLAANESVRNLRVPLRRKHGAIRLMLVDVQPLWCEGKFRYSSVFSRDITERVNLEREILEISERERRRIAGDLHDDLGQLLVGVAFLGSSLRNDLAAKSIPETRQLDRLLQVLDQAIGQTRSLVRGLHPVKPEPEGLMLALADLASRTRTVFHVRCRFHCREPVPFLDRTTATHLYRIAQEAVTNSIKHGKPRCIEIRLSRTSGRINLTIKDNGVGLSARPRKKPGMGLRIMRYRAGVIGGSLDLQQETGGGTTVVCSLPESAAALDCHPR